MSLSKCRILSLLIFFSAVLKSYSQQPEKENTENYKKIISFHRQSKALSDLKDTSAFDLERKAISLAERSGDDREKIICYNHFGRTLLEFGKPEQAEQVLLKAGYILEDLAIDSLYAEQQYHLAHALYLMSRRRGIETGENALRAYEKLKDTTGLLKAYSLAGLNYLEHDKFTKAADLYMKALKLHELCHEPFHKSLLLNNIGMLYFRQGDFERALKYFLEDKNIKDTLQMLEKRYLGVCYNNLSKTYWSLGKKDTAFTYLHKAHAIRKTGLGKVDAAQSYYSMGEMFMKAEVYDSAVIYLDSAMELARQVNNPSIMIAVNTALGEIFYFRKQYKEGIRFNERALELLKLYPNANDLVVAYYNLHWIYYDTKQYEKAIELLDRYYTVKDSVFSIERLQLAEELEVQYETSKKELEIRKLEKDKLIAERKRQISFYRILGLVLTLILLIIISFLLIRNERLKKKALKNELAQKQQELMSFTLNLIEKNKLLTELEAKVGNLQSDLPDTVDKKGLDQVRGLIRKGKRVDVNWAEFKKYFDHVHPGFIQRLKKLHPQLTTGELRICAMIRAMLNNHEIASLLGISPNSVYMARHRIHKKLNLSSRGKLTDFIFEF